ncbi:MAG: ABC transporter permease, partial [Planctomycetes bacterium]|nr:ABC transporter permease [Planctomycetota bacterium]
NKGDPTRADSFGIIRGDFGKSIVIERGRDVWALIKDRLPVTIKLNLLSILVIYMIAIPAGVLSAVRQNSIEDRSMSLVFFLLYSLPSFWVGLLIIIGVANYFSSWPIGGLYADVPPDASYWTILAATARHYVIPVFCLSYGGFAGLSRFTRVSMLEVVRQDYIRTARAKGLNEATVIMKHALRNSLIPLVTIFAGLLPSLIGGSIIIEYLFNIPGMGTLGLDALGNRDYPVLMTIFGFGAGLTLIGILISDITYSIVDPRISFE